MRERLGGNSEDLRRIEGRVIDALFNAEEEVRIRAIRELREEVEPFTLKRGRVLNDEMMLIVQKTPTEEGIIIVNYVPEEYREKPIYPFDIS